MPIGGFIQVAYCLNGLKFTVASSSQNANRKIDIIPDSQVDFSISVEVICNCGTASSSGVKSLELLKLSIAEIFVNQNTRTSTLSNNDVILLVASDIRN